LYTFRDRVSRTIYFPRLASNHNPPGRCLLSCKDYRCEPPRPGSPLPPVIGEGCSYSLLRQPEEALGQRVPASQGDNSVACRGRLCTRAERPDKASSAAVRVTIVSRLQFVADFLTCITLTVPCVICTPRFLYNSVCEMSHVKSIQQFLARISSASSTSNARVNLTNQCGPYTWRTHS
jgi:hypothetical protein